MTKSSIEWTDETWNPITGCTKVSPGCANCYAERFANRLQAMLKGDHQYQDAVDKKGMWSGNITLVDSMLTRPLHWKKPRRVFVNSMSDMFHEDVPLQFIKQIFEVMNQCEQHIFQILTKRPERMADLSGELEWPEQVWAGTSVESQEYTHRIDSLQEVPASIRFLSLEPLLGPIADLDLSGIDWVIVGGESGPGARRMKPDWVIDIFEACKDQEVPFFFKQWGAYGPDGERRSKKENGRQFQGEIWNEFPEKFSLGI